MRISDWSSDVCSSDLQQHGRLQGKHLVAVEILVQAVVVAGIVAQQQRRRPLLSGAMATPKITGMIRRKARRDAKGGVPAVGDLRQRRVERFAQTRDDLRQRIGEVAVLAAAEAVTCHDDAARSEEHTSELPSLMR